MKRYDFIVFLAVLFFSTAAMAAPNSASGPWGVDYESLRPQFANFSAAVNSPVTAGKTIVITKPVATNTLTVPTDRHIRIGLGGRLDPAAGKILTIKSIDHTGNYRKFGGSGTVVMAGAATNGVTPSEWGAVGTVNASSEVRTANTAAINAAFNAIKSTGGELYFPDLYETNGTFNIGSMTEDHNYIVIRGSNAETSGIHCFADNVPAVDGSGRSNVKLRDFKILAFGSAGSIPSAGLLVARTDWGGAGQGNASQWSLSGVHIRGGFIKGALVTIAAEEFNAVDCNFESNYTGSAAFSTSTNNASIGITSTNTTIAEGPNTAVRFTNCTFYLPQTGTNAIKAENALDGSFEGCLIISGAAAGNVLVKIISNSGGRFNGLLTFDKCLVEGVESTGFYFDYVGAAGDFRDITINSCTLELYGSSPVLFAYKDAATTTFVNFRFERPKKGDALGGSFTIPALIGGYITAGNFGITTTGELYQSFINVSAVTYNPSTVTYQSTIIEAGRSTYGVAPTPANGGQATGHTEDRAQKLTIAPVTEVSVTPQTGEIINVDSSVSGGGVPGVTSATGQNQILFHNGINWVPMGALPGTPANATASGYKGTVLFDANYVYICTAPNTWKRATIAGW